MLIHTYKLYSLRDNFIHIIDYLYIIKVYHVTQYTVYDMSVNVTKQRTLMTTKHLSRFTESQQ